MKAKLTTIFTMLVITTILALPFSFTNRAVAAEPLAPVISIDPTSFDVAQPVDTTLGYPMTIYNTGDEILEWEFYDLSWSDNFDSYPVDTSLHGVGGWHGWDNVPAATAYTTDDQAHSLPNSVNITGASDLVHEYSGYTTGLWYYTAWQFIPTTFSGQSYFILLNTYENLGTNNWSLEVQFDSATDTVINDGPVGGTLPIIYDEWVKIEVVIDLTNNTQTVYYGDTQLFTGSWTEGMSGGGVLNIAAVDLFANNASPVYYDDISLSMMEPLPGPCEPLSSISWVDAAPLSGTTPVSGSSPVEVIFITTGLVPDQTYTGTLCISSNDPLNPVVELPIALTPFLAEPDITVDTQSIMITLGMTETGEALLTIGNIGDADLEITDITGLQDWLTASFTQTTILPGGTQVLTFTFDTAGLALGEYTTAVVLHTNDPDEPTVTINVTLIVTEATLYYLYLPIIMKNE